MQHFGSDRRTSRPPWAWCNCCDDVDEVTTFERKVTSLKSWSSSQANPVEKTHTRTSEPKNGSKQFCAAFFKKKRHDSRDSVVKWWTLRRNADTESLRQWHG
jgi:hypothetical protein